MAWYKVVKLFSKGQIRLSESDLKPTRNISMQPGRWIRFGAYLICRYVLQLYQFSREDLTADRRYFFAVRPRTVGYFWLDKPDEQAYRYFTNLILK